jgi:hypothetical protein
MEWFAMGLLVAGLVANLLLLGTLDSRIKRLTTLISLHSQFSQTFIEAFQRHFDYMEADWAAQELNPGELQQREETWHNG